MGTQFLTNASLLMKTKIYMKKLLFGFMMVSTIVIAKAQNERGNNTLQDNWFLKNYTATDDRYATESSPYVSDAEYVRRLKALPTIIEMPFNNIVKDYIEKYTVKGRKGVPALLGLGLYYNPIFEQALEERGLPLELKYLPMVESGLDPNAVSVHGATGLWQFMLPTAKGLGMEVNSLIDERRDPYLSSELAATYLQNLYEAYNDWSLAIAAYNCGPGTVNKALARAGGDASTLDYWSIYNYLPAETRGYVPKFIAINYVMKYYPEHNISPVLRTAPLVIDTVHVTDRIHLRQISEVLDIPMEQLRELNPQFRADIIPGSTDMPRNLILPSQQIHAYLMSENDIKNYDSAKYNQRGVVNPGDTDTSNEELLAEEDTEIWMEPAATANTSNSTGKKQNLVHKVKAGETLASIAALYEITPEEIKMANGLSRNAVRVGQQLRISSSSPQAIMETTVAAVTNQKTTTTAPVKQTTQQTKTQTTAQTKQQPKQQAKQQSKQQTKQTTKTGNQKKAATPSTYNVKNGDNLTTIAKKTGTTVEALKKANNMKDDKLRAGATIKIPKSTGNTKKSTTATKQTAKTAKTNTKKKK